MVSCAVHARLCIAMSCYAMLCYVALCYAQKWLKILLAMLPLLLVQFLYNCVRTAVYIVCSMNAVDQNSM